MLSMHENDKFEIFPMFLLSAAMRRVKTWATKEGKKRKKSDIWSSGKPQ